MKTCSEVLIVAQLILYAMVKRVAGIAVLHPMLFSMIEGNVHSRGEIVLEVAEQIVFLLLPFPRIHKQMQPSVRLFIDERQHPQFAQRLHLPMKINVSVNGLYLLFAKERKLLQFLNGGSVYINGMFVQILQFLQIGKDMLFGF